MSSAAPSQSDNADQGNLILVVDDELVILESVSDLLNQEGFATLTAENGLQALQILQTRTPDLIISDVMMPELDGFEFYDRVRLNSAWMLIPFIFLTARGQASDIRHGLGLGADAYVTKPFTREDLLTSIRSRLNRMRQIERAAQGNIERLQQNLLSMFSHELRTPLSHIYGFASLLDDHKALDPAEMDEVVAGIQTGAERLSRLVEDSLLIARIDSGELKAEVMHYRQPVELALLAQQAAQNKSSMAEKHRVTMDMEVAHEIVISCMAAHLQDALTRLLDNAIKFSAPGGGNAVIHAEISADGCVISVRDNGIGIQPDQQRVLFERFRQIGREQREQQGVGLGLAITQGIIEAHGGKIEVASEGIPGQGSTVTIMIPM